jgi:hypothetical protein
VWADGTEMNAGQAALPYSATALSFESCEAVAVQAIEQWRERLRLFKLRAHGPTLPPDPWFPWLKEA